MHGCTDKMLGAKLGSDSGDICWKKSGVPTNILGIAINPRPIKGGARPKGGGQFKIETGRMARKTPKYSRQEGTGQISPGLNPDLSVDRP